MLADSEALAETAVKPIRAPTSAAKPTGAERGRAAFSRVLSLPGVDVTRGALLLKIDDFAGLEDRIGHVDAEALSGLVETLVRSQLGPLDQLFLFSVDELAVLIQRDEQAEIGSFAETLRRRLSVEIFSVNDHEAKISATVALIRATSSVGAEAMIRQLVTAARSACANGGNRCVALGTNIGNQQSAREEARIAALTRRGLSEDRLKLAYQSIASLEGESRSHYDVLVRLFDDTGREWRASEFLPAAQKFNLMRSIDRWVTGTVLDIIRGRKPDQEPAVLFVKLSEDSLRDGEAFLVWLKALLQGRRLNPDEIVFEAQERVLHNHIRRARSLLLGLSELGAGIAIEHFGIGASSIQLIDHIPVQFVKFHASYTQSFGDQGTQKRLAELVDAAKARRIQTIVSHVEDANVMARLWQIGVNYIQGYHVQQPEVVLMSGDFAGRP